MSRIVVVDDHPVFRRGLAALLRSAGHEVVAEAADGLEAIAIVAADQPDLVVMDLSMPTRDGFEATAHLTARFPQLAVLVVTLFDDRDSVVRALEAGASGYVSKQTPPEQLLAAVVAVLQGAQWLGAGVARPPLATGADAASLPGLTPRERDIADLVARGLTNPMIAAQLHLSTKTVANYVSTIALKLDAASREDLGKFVRAAKRGGDHPHA